MCLAQTEVNPLPNVYSKAEKSLYTVVETATKYTNRIFTTTGFTYHADDLAVMPTRSINKIASLTMGVQLGESGTPVIRGAKDGTAYFVDGVRVRSGALAIAGFSW